MSNNYPKSELDFEQVSVCIPFLRRDEAIFERVVFCYKKSSNIGVFFFETFVRCNRLTDLIAILVSFLKA